MPQLLLVDGFKLVENTYQFNRNFKKNYNEDSQEGKTFSKFAL